MSFKTLFNIISLSAVLFILSVYRLMSQIVKYWAALTCMTGAKQKKFDRLIDWLIDWEINQQIGWPTDWLSIMLMIWLYIVCLSCCQSNKPVKALFTDI